MCKIRIAFRVMILLLLPATASADIGLRDYFWMGVGATIPIIAHEAGHKLAGGDRVEWQDDKWKWECVEKCNASYIAASGFSSEVLVTEAVGQAFRGSDARAFRIGLRASAGLHLIGYAIRDRDDFENFSDRTRDRARIAIAILGAWNLLQLKKEF